MLSESCALQYQREVRRNYNTLVERTARRNSFGSFYKIAAGQAGVNAICLVRSNNVNVQSAHICSWRQRLSEARHFHNPPRKLQCEVEPQVWTCISLRTRARQHHLSIIRSLATIKMCNGNALAKLAAKSTVATGGDHWNNDLFIQSLSRNCLRMHLSDANTMAVSEDVRSHAVSEAAHSLICFAPTRPAPKQIVQTSFDPTLLTNVGRPTKYAPFLLLTV